MSLLPVGIGSSGSYEIAKSLRFRASASAYLSRTPGSAGNRRTWTWSGWVKRGALGTTQSLFNAGANSSTTGYTYIAFMSDNTLGFQIRDAGGAKNLYSSAVFRDPSAHLHVLVAVDTDNATASLRRRIYVNGAEITAFSINDTLTQGTDTSVNQVSTVQRFGVMTDSGGALALYLDGYLSEINFIDGQALTPTSFGEFDANTGVWVPKKYTGTYGTNGFYLPFNDGTSLGNLCLDRSGNANNWTATNVSLTAGVTYDWMDDTPTNNFAVLNPLNLLVNAAGSMSEANLRITSSGTSNGVRIRRESSIAAESFATYAEFIVLATSGTTYSGVEARRQGASEWVALSFAQSSNSAQIVTELGNQQTGLGFVAANDVLSVSVDSSGMVTFRKNDVVLGVAQQLNGSGPVSISCSAATGGAGANQASIAANFGQRPFAYTPPTGFLPLCTKNTGAIAPISSGSFTGNASADGPFVWLAGTPNSMTINGNAVTFGTHADRLANGFKVRTSSASYNAAGSNTFSVASFVDDFTDPNRAKANP
jgi:hypothetical protein